MKRQITCLAAAAVCFVFVTEARAQDLTTTEHRITDSPSIDTTPTLGSNAGGSLLVYNSQEIGPSSILPGIINVQLLTDEGAPVGSPLIVSDGLTDDKLNDVFGDFVVFPAFEATTSSLGRILLHDLSMGTTIALFSEPTPVRQARIHGDSVVWVQGQISEAQIMYYDLNWAASGRGPQAITSGSPAAVNVEIGSNYIVWNTSPGSVGTSDVIAVDRSDPALANPLGQVPTLISISARTDADEQNASTDGDWIVWEMRVDTSALRTTHAFNPVTGEARVIQDVAASRNPSIHGDLVAYESNAGASGAFDIYLYRLSDQVTFQITDDPNDQLLNNIHGNLVAYVDNRTSFADVFVTSFSFGANLPDIEVAPMMFEFGDVEIGSSSATIVTLSNTGGDDLIVGGIALQAGSSGDYTITMAPPLPATIGTGETVDVTVSYAPTAAGASAAVLEITSNDSNEGLVQVGLMGNGVLVDQPPSEQIMGLLDFIVIGLADGTLEGNGPGRSAGGRAKAFVNMIESSGDLIEEGSIADACDQLLDVLKRIDGEPRPPDFLTGADAEAVEMLIIDLRASLGCS